MFTLQLARFRTFADASSTEIRPLTILTGENSSGKTSFLAALAAVCAPTFPVTTEFNRPPFSLGGFATTATREGRTSADSFSLGFVADLPHPARLTMANATYVAGPSGQSVLSAFDVSTAKDRVVIDGNRSTPDTFAGTMTVRDLQSGTESHMEFSAPRRLGGDTSLSELWLPHPPDVGVPLGSHETLALLTLHLFRPPRKVLAVAPIRARPERTYDQVLDSAQADGDHVPFVLERLFREAPENSDFRTAISRFGEESGLFTHIRPRRLGDAADAPFQLMVEERGSETNIVDVGYGVSQILPLIVESINAPQDTFVLLQQPEIHLHPRAQAALGTFFANLVSTAKKNLVVETHSDHLIDRVRQEVAAGRLRAADVALLFFERTGSKTRIHDLRLDREGNITNAPASYRAFFLEEELRLLSR